LPGFADQKQALSVRADHNCMQCF